MRNALPGIQLSRHGRLTRMERYALGHTLRACAVALAIIASIILLIDFVEISRNVPDRVDVAAPTLIGLTLMHAPNVILQLLPFVFLFGTLAAYVGLNRRSELIAMRAAGVSAWRFIFPAAFAALTIGILTVGVFSPVAAMMDARYDVISQRIQQAGAPGSTAGVIWLREGDAQRQVTIRAASRRGTTLRDAAFLIYAIEPGGQRLLSSRIEARTATLRPGTWVLTDAREATRGNQAKAYANMSMPSTLDPIKAFQAYADPQSVPVWSLPGLITQIERAGFSATAYRLRLQQLFALPLMFAAMSVLAAAFSLRLLRLGDLAILVVSAVVLGFVLFFFNQFSAALGKAEVLPAFVAAWAPPLLALLSAFALLSYTEDG